MKLKLNCREVTRLVLEGELRKLGTVEGLALRLHWLICDGCRRFARQNATLRLALDRWRGYREEQ